MAVIIKVAYDLRLKTNEKQIVTIYFGHISFSIHHIQVSRRTHIRSYKRVLNQRRLLGTHNYRAPTDQVKRRFVQYGEQELSARMKSKLDPNGMQWKRPMSSNGLRQPDDDEVRHMHDFHMKLQLNITSALPLYALLPPPSSSLQTVTVWSFRNHACLVKNIEKITQLCWISVRPWYHAYQASFFLSKAGCPIK